MQFCFGDNVDDYAKIWPINTESLEREPPGGGSICGDESGSPWSPGFTHQNPRFVFSLLGSRPPRIGGGINTFLLPPQHRVPGPHRRNYFSRSIRSTRES